jgi:hypothetical protein
MDDVGFLNKNSAVFKSVTVKIAGMKMTNLCRSFSIISRIMGWILQLIEPSWWSVFQKLWKLYAKLWWKRKLL